MVEISVLVDNTVAASRPKGLRAEWGFSALVDGVLFDAGQSDCAYHNAGLLGIDPAIETIVLSHAHYDHTSGLSNFLGPERRPTLYCHPTIWVPRYSIDGDSDAADETDSTSGPESVGMEISRDEIERGAELVEHREPIEVAPGVHALGEIPRIHAEATVGKLERHGELVDDPVTDDQALAVETDEGIALVLGCGHAGLRNTIEYADSVVGEPVRHVIGGTHLVAMDGTEVREIADWLDGRLDTFAGCHCTGFEAQRILARELPGAFRPVGVGSVLEIGE